MGRVVGGIVSADPDQEFSPNHPSESLLYFTSMIYTVCRL